MPIMPRLKQLFLSQETAVQMRWHSEGIRERDGKDVMAHSSNGAAWQALDHFDSEFARDLRNVRLGLSTDDFTPFITSNNSYSLLACFYHVLPSPSQHVRERRIHIPRDHHSWS